VFQYEFSCVIQSFHLDSGVTVDTGDTFNVTVMWVFVAYNHAFTYRVLSQHSYVLRNLY